MKQLKIWNGKGWGGRRYDKDGNYTPDPTGKEYCDHAYVCANSRAHAVRLLQQAGHRFASDSELKNYWSACWGDPMKDIKPEIGVWTSQDWCGDKPKRIL